MDAMMVDPALILVVDDDVRTARLLVRMLRDDGFEVELATDGATAIGRLGRQPMPDVLVTDLRMPHADGMAVARYARSRRPNLPVFVVTGYPHLVAPGGSLSIEPPPVVHAKPIDYARLSSDLRRCADVSEQVSRRSRACP
jgi:DNA-binding NtrC family response regulator